MPARLERRSRRGAERLHVVVGEHHAALREVVEVGRVCQSVVWRLEAHIVVALRSAPRRLSGHCSGVFPGGAARALALRTRSSATISKIGGFAALATPTSRAAAPQLIQLLTISRWSGPELDRLRGASKGVQLCTPQAVSLHVCCRLTPRGLRTVL